MSPPARTALVHLVWGPAGLVPFESFLDSYHRHDAGAEHELVLLYNCVGDAASLRPFRERAAGLAARELVLDAPCLDLAAYRQAAGRLEHERLCFVNSYSTPTTPGWLGLLEAPLADRRVGAAGATGSYGSHLSYALFQLGGRSPYGDALRSRRAAREVMHELSGTRVPGPLEHWLYTLSLLVRRRRGARRFPVPHLRTNGFAIERALFLALCRGALRAKWDAYRIESGPGSITARLRALNRPPVVVDRHGVVREVPAWHRADGFWQGAQEDLLIADNQTRSYADATPRQRAVLSALAWGPWARPR